MSSQKTIYDDFFNLISDTISNAESSESSDSSSSADTIKIVKQFTAESIEEKQVAVGITNLTNMNNSECSDYEISAQIMGQTYYENDPQKEQILQLFGIVSTAIENLTIDEIEMYIDNIAGFLYVDSNFESDQETNSFIINIKLYVTNLK